jgi:hypothetical protein
MQILEVIPMVFSVALGLLGGSIIVANYAIVIRWYVRRQHSSLVPLLGGLLFATAMYIFPGSSLRRWSWVPLIADLGCSLSIPGFLYAVFVLKCFKK